MYRTYKGVHKHRAPVSIDFLFGFACVAPNDTRASSVGVNRNGTRLAMFVGVFAG